MNACDWVSTQDGTVTLRAMNGELYNDPAGALHTAFSAFAYSGALLSVGEKVRVLDIGFGLGLNATAAWSTVREIGASLSLLAIEPESSIFDCFDAWPAPFSVRAPREEVGQVVSGQKKVPGLQLRLLKKTLADAQPEMAADYHAIFLDPWSPAVQPELWQPDVLQDLYRRLHPGGYLVARSHDGTTQAFFEAAGFEPEIQAWPAEMGESIRIKKTA